MKNFNNKTLQQQRLQHRKVKRSQVSRLGRVNWLTKLINDMFAVKSKRLLVDIYANVCLPVVGRKSQSLIHLLVIWIKRAKWLASHGGREYLVLYLKACHVLLMQASSGQRIEDPRRLGAAVSRTKSGIPRIIPSLWRKKIRSGDTRYLRLCLTLFSVYRILECKPKLRLSSITDPGRDWSSVAKQVKTFVLVFFRYRPLKIDLSSDLVARPVPSSKVSSVSQMPKASSMSSTSVYGIVQAAAYWAQSAFELLSEWCDLTQNDLLMQNVFEWSEGANFQLEPLESFENKSFGRLGTKYEAAGKVRVFAMVDPITNWVLRPLHKKIFSWLRQIPMDGTFDQIAPIRRLIDRFPGKSAEFYSYDLSAATDRLPVDLQVLILSPILGEELAQLWKRLLVERDYDLPQRGGPPLVLRYQVGQPMGALSSWAMLALSHHFIVQWAYWRVNGQSIDYSGLQKGEFPFTDYAILGDDIVIANRRVAREYVKLMAELGVGIGFAKSLLSRKGGLEFAKRFFLRGVDCSPVPFKEVFASLQSLGAMVEFQKKYSLTLAQVFTIKGKGYRLVGSLNKRLTTVNKRVRAYFLVSSTPFSEFGSIMQFVLWDTALRGTLGGRCAEWNWGACLWEYIAHVQRTLVDRHSSKVKRWNRFAKAMKSQVNYETSVDGLFLDTMDAGFSEDIYPGGDPRIASTIAMTLYYEIMQESWRELKRVETELTEIYTWAMNSGSIGTGWETLKVKLEVLEDIHKHFYSLDKALSEINIPGDTERRPSDKRIFKNPLFVAALHRRLRSKLASRTPWVGDMRSDSGSET